jgi:hypothetical protein
MDDGISPQGQMELRLEAFQDTSLTDLEVDYDGTVTARHCYSDTHYYVFKVSPYGANGVPVFSWYEVTAGEFDIYTRSREHRGPSRTLSELLAEGGSDGPVGNLWRKGAMALIGIHEVAAAAIQEAIDQAVSEASYAASEGLTKWFQKPASPPPIPDVDTCFEAFQAACQQRAPYCDGIQMDWGHNLGQLPGVAFALAPGAPDQILYQADPTRARQLYLNGFWTSEYCLEEDLLAQFPDDGWARLGARNAARDLLAIQSAGCELMEAQKQETLQELDEERTDYLLLAAMKGRSFDKELPDWNAEVRRCLQEDCVNLFERVREYLNGLHPKRDATNQEPRRPPKPGNHRAAATS